MVSNQAGAIRSCLGLAQSLPAGSPDPPKRRTSSSTDPRGHAAEGALAGERAPDRSGHHPTNRRGARPHDDHGESANIPRVVPAAHRREVRSNEHGGIDEQASAVLARVEPAADAIRALVESGEVSAGLMMVWWFDDPAGGYDAMSWWLSPEQMRLPARMGASIDSDEYAGDFTAHGPS